MLLDGVLLADRVITGDADLEHAWVRIAGGMIAEVGSGDIPSGSVEVVDGWLIPGFVDLHAHGGGGHSFAAGEVEGAVAFHAAHGTTSMLASLVSADVDALLDQIARLRPHVEAARLAGVHLEGPFLATGRCGAHDVASLQAPSAGAIARLLRAHADILRMVTLAPELDGAIEAVHTLDEAGVIAALGHSDADADTTHIAVNAGARMITHCFNAMRPLHHRQPGMLDVALLDDRLTCELILDGEHLSDQVTELAMRVMADRWIAVTDAVSAAGAPDGDFLLGDVPVTAKDGVVRVRATGALAGSTLTMDRAFAAIVDRFGRSPLEAVRATSTRPAALLGRHDIGAIRVGARADLLAWREGQLQRVMRGGRWIG